MLGVALGTSLRRGYGAAHDVSVSQPQERARFAAWTPRWKMVGRSLADGGGSQELTGLVNHCSIRRPVAAPRILCPRLEAIPRETLHGQCRALFGAAFIPAVLRLGVCRT